MASSNRRKRSSSKQDRAAPKPAAATPSPKKSAPSPASAAAHASKGSDWDPAREGTVADRRVIPDRRAMGLGGPTAGSADTGLERRRGPGRRRADHMRSAEEGEMTKEQFLFLVAIDAFKRVNGKTFPTWSDVLEIIRRLGYRKAQPSMLNLPNAEDWTERPDAPFAPASTGMAYDELDAFDDEDDEFLGDDGVDDDSLDEAA